MKIGYRVKLVTDRFPDKAFDPKWGGIHGFTEGRVARILETVNKPIRVEWDNKNYNSYDEKDLEIIIQPLDGLIEFINDTLVI
jgi:hypothetical protein